MKITIKHNLIIFHHPQDWDKLQQQLIEEYGKSVILVRDKCRRELGFTPRHHKGLVPYLEKYGNPMGNPLTAGDPHSDELLKKFVEENKHKMAYDCQVYLDFYNKSAMSWFVLKYLNN